MAKEKTLIITRPRPDAARLEATLNSLGYATLPAPMMEIQVLPERFGQADSALQASPAAVLITSANGVRALAAATNLRHCRIIAVGEASTAEAIAAGFTQVETADPSLGGDAKGLAEYIRQKLTPAEGALVHIAGTETAGELAETLREAGYTLSRIALYQARPLEHLPPEVQQALAQGRVEGALFYSPRTARLFLDAIRRHGLQDFLADIRAYALSTNVQHVLQQTRWKEICTASHPVEEALLALLKKQA